MPSSIPPIAISPVYFFTSSSGSGSMPSASSLLLASSNAHVCILIFQTLAFRALNPSWLPRRRYPSHHGFVLLSHTLLSGPPNPGILEHAPPSNYNTKPKRKIKKFLRSIRLISISHNSQQQTTPEPIHPRILPPFVLVFLTRRNAK